MSISSLSSTKKNSTPRKGPAPNMTIDISAIAPAKTTMTSQVPPSIHSAATGRPAIRRNNFFSDESGGASSRSKDLSSSAPESAFSSDELNNMDPCDLYAIYLQNACLDHRTKKAAEEQRKSTEEQLLQMFSLYEALRQELKALIERLEILEELKVAKLNKATTEPLLKKIVDCMESLEMDLEHRKTAFEGLANHVIVRNTEPVGIGALKGLMDELDVFSKEVDVPETVEGLVEFATGRKEVLLASRSCISLIQKVSKMTEKSCGLKSMEQLYRLEPMNPAV